MIASDKQVVHMSVNVRLPLAGGLIKQTTMGADWSFFSVVNQTLTNFFWSTGWEVISNRCSHSSMVLIGS